MSEQGRRPGGVQSVDRAIVLLEALTDLGGEATLSELGEASGLPMPTIHRLLATLVGRGYVRKGPSRRYALGPRLIRLGETAGRQLGSGAQPHLARAARELGETVNLAMLDRDRVVYVAQASSAHSMRMFTEVGRRVYCHCTGVGKAVLAQLPDEAVLEVLAQAGMPAVTDRSITDQAALLADLATVRERGYAVDDGEQEAGVRCFAVAVPDAPAPTAVSVSGPASRLGPDFADRAVPGLRATARAVSAELAGRG